MKVGYSFWGFTADYRLVNGEEFSASDGCYLYVWSIFQELLKRGHEVYRMMPNRDVEAIEKYDIEAFSLFSKSKRYNVYKNTNQADLNNLPELDVLFLEWRWPIPGRNCKIDARNPEYTPDLDIQTILLNYYRRTRTVIIGSDQDYKMEDADVNKVNVVFDWGYKHGQHVDVPFDWDEISQFPIKSYSKFPIAYVGSRYERDWSVNKYLAPISKDVDITLFGNWLERDRNSDKDWPDIKFPKVTRLTNFEVKDILSTTKLSPLLAKESYCKYGLMTGRIIECLLFGAIPVGLEEFKGIGNYLPKELVVQTRQTMLELSLRPLSKSKWINSLRKTLSWLDAKNYVDKIEEAYNYGKFKRF